MDTWISVKDAQPMIHKDVLLHYTDGTILIGCRFRFGYLFEGIHGKITHWKVLAGPAIR